MTGGASSQERVAGPEDVASVAACLASAFYEDPVWGLWAFPDERDREQRLFEFMRGLVAAGVRHPWVRKADRCEAVTVWIPPGEPEMTVTEEQEFDGTIGVLAGPRAPAIRRLFGLFEEHHPHEPHYYLSLWGTHRDHQGRGIGAKLIREGLAMIDGEGIPAYLESTNPANVARYEALGFRPRGSFGTDGAPTITTMWREAR